ncbi:RNA-binding S4 domain-containing protein [Paraconexibacter sp. AEG42_29]|uniref:RNA-binding S4 domain-containing protein n=1 Tax=Paraconexibacter sp. AEG42_29 TaxID=2997339 RepID=UPI00339D97A4
MTSVSEPLRVDKWLWAARFTKTRALAAEAVGGGRVTVNGVKAKPAKMVKPGDELALSLGPVKVEVIVRDTSGRRGPAKEAVLLYDETPESLARREAYAAQRRSEPRPVVREGSGARPTKRDRRRYEAERQERRGA